jgi:hypothetical protein
LSSSGAYQGEMGSESHIDTEVAGFLADLRAAYVSEPEEALASRHLAAMAREAELVLPRRRPEPAGWRRTMRNRFIRPVAKLSAATAAAILGTAGLAVAGVNLPDPAKDAFQRAGITLPNQAGGGQSGEHSRSDEVHSVLEATPPSERGCAFGHSVAEAARESALPEHAQAACDHASEPAKAKGTNESSSHSEFGRETSERAKGLKDATVDERKSFGQETSTRARENGGAPEGTPGGDHRADTPAGGGTTGAPEGTPSGPPEGTPSGPPDTAPVPDGTPDGPPAGTPSGRP